MPRTKQTARKSYGHKPTPPSPNQANRRPPGPVHIPSVTFHNHSSQDPDAYWDHLNDTRRRFWDDEVGIPLTYWRETELESDDQNVLPTATTSNRTNSTSTRSNKTPTRSLREENSRRFMMTNQERIEMLKRRKIEIDKEIHKLEELERYKSRIVELEAQLEQMEQERLEDEVVLNQGRRSTSRSQSGL